MKFKEIKKRKVYRTWFHKNRRTGLISYIHFTPKTKISYTNFFFHFEISSAKNRTDDGYKYSSLDDRIIFETYEDCREAIIKCHRNYL